MIYKDVTGSGSLSYKDRLGLFFLEVQEAEELPYGGIDRYMDREGLEGFGPEASKRDQLD